MSDKLIPAIIAGVVTFIIAFAIGLLSRFAPFIGCCNCLVPIAGGIFAVFLYSNKADVITPSSGASVGLLAGAVYCIISLFVTPISLFLQWNTMQAQLAPSLRELRRNGIDLDGGTLIIAIIVMVIVGLAVFIGLYALGGLIGGNIFKKENQPSSFEPPMPPSSYAA